MVRFSHAGRDTVSKRSLRLFTNEQAGVSMNPSGAKAKAPFIDPRIIYGAVLLSLGVPSCIVLGIFLPGGILPAIVLILFISLLAGFLWAWRYCPQWLKRHASYRGHMIICATPITEGNSKRLDHFWEEDPRRYDDKPYPFRASFDLDEERRRGDLCKPIGKCNRFTSSFDKYPSMTFSSSHEGATSTHFDHLSSFNPVSDTHRWYDEN